MTFILGAGVFINRTYKTLYMEVKDSMSAQLTHTMRIYNPHNYSFIFKKTEKIACAVFYITNNGANDVLENNKLVLYIQDAAQRALESVLTMLTDTSAGGATDAVRELLRLQSAIHLGVASGAVVSEHADLIEREIEDVLRNIHAFTAGDERTDALDFDPDKVFAQAVREQKLRDQGLRTGRLHVRERQTLGTAGKSTVPGATSKPTPTVATHSDRRESIRSVLRSKGQANIKDISDVITDCSEKTIQRELIAMIKDNEVVREGERRWSMYKLV